MRSLVGLNAALSVLLVAPGLLAQEPEAASSAGQGSAEVELGLYSTSDDASSVTALSPLLSGRYRLVDRLSLSAVWGAAVAWANPEGAPAVSRARPGNPWLAGHYHFVHGKTTTRVGLGATVPLGTVPRDNDGQLVQRAFDLALGMRGLWDAWLFAPEQFAIVAPARSEMRPWRGLRLGAEGAAAVLLPTGDFVQQASVFVQAAVDGEVRFGIGSVGTRLQAVFMPTNALDRMQWSAVPWLQLRFANVRWRLRFVLNIDEPNGLLSEGLGVWGLHVMGGAEW